MFRSWGTIDSPIFADIEEGRGQNGTFLGDFTWNDQYIGIFLLFNAFHLYTYGGFSQIPPEVLGISLLKFAVPLPATILHMLKKKSARRPF